MIIPERCPTEGCGQLPHNRKSQGYCTKHWARYRKYGDATFTKYPGAIPKLSRLAKTTNHKGPHRKHPLYRTWDGMKLRCYNKLHHSYKNYGAKGITICDRWLGSISWCGFCAFVEDMGERPEGTSIDRIDSKRGYSPENCRWADIFLQNRSRKVTQN